MAFLRTLAFAACCLGGVMAVSLWPPARGELIVFYPFADNQSQVLRYVNATDTRLIAAGPVANSWVVRFENPETAGQLASFGGILLDAGGLHGCLGREQTRRKLQKQGYLREPRQ